MPAKAPQQRATTSRNFNSCYHPWLSISTSGGGPCITCVSCGALLIPTRPTSVRPVTSRSVWPSTTQGNQSTQTSSSRGNWKRTLRFNIKSSQKSLKHIWKRSEEHTSELQSHRDLHSFPTRRSSDLSGKSIHTNKFKPWELEAYVALQHKELTKKFEAYLETGSGRAFVNKSLRPARASLPAAD